MTNNRPGPGGGIRIIQPSDYDVETSTIKPAEPAEKNAAKKQTSNPTKQATHIKPAKQPAEPKPIKPPFDSTLEGWEVAAKPERKFLFAYTYWWLYTRFHLKRYEFITKPSSMGGATAEIRKNIKYMIENRKALNAIIVVLAAKGGSAKTTIIQWLAAFIGYYARLKPALIGMDLGADKTASRFAFKKEDLFSVTYLLELVKMKIPFTAQWLQKQTVTDEESGVVLFKAKPKESGIRDFQTGETIAMTKRMHQLYPLVLCDTAAGLHMKASDGAAQSADVVLVCNKGISEEALGDIKETLALPNYNIAEKRIKPIVVISGVLPRQLNTYTQYEIVAKICNVDPQNVILLPYDRYLDDQKRYNLKRVHIPALSIKSTLMLSRFAKRVVQLLVESEPNTIQSAEDAIQILISTHRLEQRTQND